MSEPKFKPGQRVRIADRTPLTHHRVPAYAKGKVGTVERICGVHGDPEKYIRGPGEPMQRVYRVRIPQIELWGSYSGAPKDMLEIEIFEHWLEVAT